ncbi:DUF4446 family protein [Candidatus Nomurabacteria bacterium]|nr:DUF4446 family protein [Candidatus Nomurabacteria bacterium]
MDSNLIIDYIPLATYILLVLLIILFAWIIRLEIRIKKLTRGEKGGSIEDALKSIEKDIRGFDSFRSDVESYLKKVEQRLSRSIQGLKNINFKAFSGLDSGGHQSFAIALLNEKGDGLILSTLHSRDRVNVFSKEIKNFRASVSLTDEEKEALEKAILEMKN